MPEAIAQEETRLATLEAEQAKTKHRLAALRAELVARHRAGDPRPPASADRGAESSGAGRKGEAIPLAVSRA